MQRLGSAAWRGNGDAASSPLAAGLLAPASRGWCPDALLSDDWSLFRQDPDGYRWLSASANRPDPETLAALLAGEDPDGLKQQLGNVDRFLDGLRN